MTPVRGLILDLDGTLYRGAEPIAGASDAVDRLLKAGLSVRYFTNNSAITTDDLVAKLQKLGFPCEPDWALGTARATAQYLREKTDIRQAHVLGSAALRSELEQAGIATQASAYAGIVSGLDRELTYDRLAEALAVLQSGARWFATNSDATYPLEGGRTIPGAGTMVGALRGMGFEPEAIIGKPSPTGVQLLIESMGLSPAEVLVVGDREETDLAAGRAAGTQVALVLSGVTAQARPGISSWNDHAHLADVSALANVLLASG